MHVPVLLERVTELLAPACAADGAVLVDATLGLAGHTLAMLDAHPGLRLIGLDRDPDARAEAARRIEAAGHSDRVTLVPAVFDELPDVLDRLGIAEVQGVLFDLGVSSLQLDRPDRGFSYSADAPLDMRMDPTGPRTAADVVNTYSAEGPRPRAARLRRGALRLPDRRAPSSASGPASRSPAPARLAELVRDVIPAATRRTGGHPAKRTFQALRIEVNDELGVLERALPAALEALAVGGRVVVITFHSLEDRIVKQTLAAGAADRTPPDMPCPLPELGPVLRLLTRGGEAADRRRGRGQPAGRLRPRPGGRAHPEGSMSSRAPHAPRPGPRGRARAAAAAPRTDRRARAADRPDGAPAAARAAAGRRRTPRPAPPAGRVAALAEPPGAVRPARRRPAGRHRRSAC